VYEPVDTGVDSQLFISKTYDATSHFETACLDVLVSVL
jgi:Rab GDP dissociation inhibitor